MTGFRTRLRITLTCSLHELRQLDPRGIGRAGYNEAGVLLAASRERRCDVNVAVRRP
jgi:hypothetical protein